MTSYVASDWRIAVIAYVSSVKAIFPPVSATGRNVAKITSAMAMILWLVTVTLVVSTTTTANASGLKCDSVRPYFENEGFPSSDIPKEAISLEQFLSSYDSEFLKHTNNIDLVCPKMRYLCCVLLYFIELSDLREFDLLLERVTFNLFYAISSAERKLADNISRYAGRLWDTREHEKNRISCSEKQLRHANDQIFDKSQTGGGSDC
ncbi:hypothetical protein EAI_15909 [Harpegnathos saltator]|uniref:Uncharacterized protein n=1 Tax=Harpegnathos saltator TaxID=610380 RepID=E2BV11_HARSA|nr:hypothetical protein EAI_15909 [Harpegnathos saltator]